MRTSEGFFSRSSMHGTAIAARACLMARDADLLWCENRKPDLEKPDISA